MLRQKYIHTIFFIVVCTTLLFIVLAVRDVRELKNYLEYVTEHGKSALFQEESINQIIASRLSREFYTRTVSQPTNSFAHADICQHLEKEGNVYGFNLVAQTLPNLTGTLQTRNKLCEKWVGDISSLFIIRKTESNVLSKFSFSGYSRYNPTKIRYYIDLTYGYIFINQLVNTKKYTFNNWLISDDGTINIAHSAHTISINDRALSDLFRGETTVSHIYQDGYTKGNIISILSPVYLGEKVKGVLITDIHINDLMASFKIDNSIFLWEFLSLFISDNETGSHIYFHKPRMKTFDLISNNNKLTPHNNIYVKLDAIYFIITRSWLLMLYILGTLVICHYTRKQFYKQELLSKENVTDTMTGLYNRKVITHELENKIRLFANKNIPVTFIAVDCDGLKKINDSLGHYMGDKAIQALGQALGNAIRKSDYGIRLGGDEFGLILVDYSLNKAHNVINRVQELLIISDSNNLVSFSWGAYQLLPGETLEVAMLKADELLYQHKRSKYEHRR